MNRQWNPVPLDTSGVQLTAELEALIEHLAENTHEVWAMERMRMGWTYGPARSDERKQTPLLIPFCDLPEEEKLYDRRIIEELIKSICCCGYDIVKK